MPEEEILEELKEEPQAEEPEAPQAESQPVEETPAAQPQPEPAKLVPLQALQEARWEHRQFKEQASQEINQLKEKLRFADELKQQIEALRKPKAPNYDEDPLGNLAMRLKETEERSQVLEQVLTQKLQMEQQAIDQQNRIRQVLNAADMMETEFKKQAPDYDDATNYLVEREKARVFAMGYTPDQANAHILQKRMQIIAHAMQNGLNVGQVAYQIAIEDGWKPGQVRQQGTNPVLQAVQQGQKASRSLSGAGKAEEANPSIQDLLNSEGEEFDRKWQKMFGSR